MWQSSADNTVWGVGDNSDSQLAICNGGAAVNSATSISNLSGTRIVDLSTAWSHAVAAFANGTAKTWGWGACTPTTVPGLTGYGIKVVATGMTAYYFADAYGRVWSMGSNKYGELGNGEASTYTTSTAVRVSNMGPP